MRAIRSVIVLTALVLMVGSAGIAATTENLSASSSTDQSSLVKCSVSPSTVNVGDTVTATDTGSTAPSGSTLDNKQTFDWGDGTHTDSTTGQATHKYTAAGTFQVNETIYGNFGDGHETDECTGSPVTVGPTPPPSGTATVKCSVSPSTVNVGDTVTATDTGSTAPSGSTLDNKQTFDWGDGTHTDSTTGQATHKYAAAGTFEVNETIYGNFGDGHETDECTGSPVTVHPAPPQCPNNELSSDAKFGACEFSGATFYAAETDPMKISVDASAVNAPSNAKSGNDPIPGDKIVTTNCGANPNACDAVTNRDTDHDITNYMWVFTAYRGNSSNQAVPIEQHSVDSGASPSAAAQFTKTQGDDVIQIVLTITENNEGKTTFTTPTPIFPIFSGGVVNKADLPPSPTTLGSVILEPCDHGGLLTAPETLGDTLGDAAAPLLVDPNANGPLSSAIEQGTVGGGAGALGNEVACVVSALPGGAL